MMFEDFCAQNNIIISFADLPLSNRGFCIYLDGNFEIIINQRYSSKSQKATIIHELLHIIQDHFFDDIQTPLQKEEEIENLLLSLNDSDAFENDSFFHP